MGYGGLSFSRLKVVESCAMPGRLEIDGTATPVSPALLNVTFSNGRLPIGEWKTDSSLSLLNPTSYVDITYLDGTPLLVQACGLNLTDKGRGCAVGMVLSRPLRAYMCACVCPHCAHCVWCVYVSDADVCLLQRPPLRWCASLCAPCCCVWGCRGLPSDQGGHGHSLQDRRTR